MYLSNRKLSKKFAELCKSKEIKLPVSDRIWLKTGWFIDSNPKNGEFKVPAYTTDEIFYEIRKHVVSIMLTSRVDIVEAYVTIKKNYDSLEKDKECCDALLKVAINMVTNDLWE